MTAVRPYLPTQLVYAVCERDAREDARRVRLIGLGMLWFLMPGAIQAHDRVVCLARSLRFGTLV